MIGLIAANLRELRKRGLTAADLLALEKLAILAKGGGGKVRVADLGRMLGIGRSGAHKRLVRLEEKGVVVRFFRCVCLNVRGLLSVDAAAAKSRAACKALVHWTKRLKRRHAETQTRQTERKSDETAQSGAFIAQWSVGDVVNGRQIVGQRRFGVLAVPVWG